MTRESVKYVPAWFPGARFKRDALFARKLAWDMRAVPFKTVKAQLVSSGRWIGSLASVDTPLVLDFRGQPGFLSQPTPAIRLSS